MTTERFLRVLTRYRYGRGLCFPRLCWVLMRWRGLSRVSPWLRICHADMAFGLS